ncbi:MipA/OmpV family protein [Fluviibacterium sp. DFM31]|uniref:MipA/OmpV family protein n=1 Tax=Meridianimarinicoccus marinus TaxID=3231483 RepID=A0ABV3L9X5_9RHOB
MNGFSRHWMWATILAAAVGGAAQAQTQYDEDNGRLELPLWELGIGLTGRQTAEYPGASDYATRVVAFPYIAYRGKFLEIGEQDTLRFIPFQTERFELAFSFDGNSAVERRSTELHGALPDLDALVEFGPEFIWRAAEIDPVFGDRTLGRVELALQTRGAFSVGWPPEYEGFVVRPVLRYRQNGALKPGSRVEAAIGPLFGTQGINEYFYAVDDSNGDGYKASHGYMGTEITASIRYPVSRRVRLIGGVGLGILSGAVSEDSPLFESNFNASGYIGFTASIFQSKRQALKDR